MEHSILIVGHAAFGRMIRAQLEPLTSSTIVLVPDAVEAKLAMQTQTPDFVIIQGGDLGLAQSCLNLQSRSNFQWFYSLVVAGNDPNLSEEAETRIQRQTQAF